MGVKQEDIDRAIASGNKFMAQLKRDCPKPGEPGYTAPKKRIRQNTKGPNKLEREAMEMLKAQKPWLIFRFHTLTVILANGVRYTPDIVAFNKNPHISTMSCVEVKGKQMWDDAVVKVKVAAHEWPHIKWGLMWKENGQWQTQEVLP